MSTNLFNPSDKRSYPSRWPLYRGKQLFRVIDERSEDGTEELLSVSHITGITPRSQKNVTMFQAESLVGYKLCQIGDIVANTMWTWQGAIGVSDYTGVVSPAYNVYRQNGDIFNPRFLDMLLRERGLIDVYHSLSTGIRPSRLRLYPDVFLTIRFPVPARDEQDQIVRYLDWKTSSVNKLIKHKRQEILELDDLKRTITYRAVTKGLCPNAPMRNSDELWLGTVPEHWELGKAKHFIRITNGSNPLTAGNIPVYGSGKESFKTCGEYKTGPAVLLGRKGSIKNPAYIEGLYWNVDTAFDVKTIVPDYSLKYFYYLAECFDYDYYTTQTAIPSMTQTDYENIHIPVPRLDEQECIVNFLDKKCSEIELMIKNIQSYIQILTEFKLRLLSDVVTGKIDVRGIEIPDYEYVADETDTDSNEDANIEETDEQEE